MDATGTLRIQCKRYANYAPITKIEEVSRLDGIACLVTKADRKPVVIALYLDDFIKILNDIGEVYDENDFRHRKHSEAFKTMH